MDSQLNSLVRPLAGLLVAAAVVSGCVTSAGVPGPSARDASVSPAPSASASDSVAGKGFYLRAWQTQALAPQYEFGSLPAATIADGQYINGMVAIPAIYPGPIYVGVSARPISAAGIDAIVAEARKDGLLGAKTDFNDAPAPGSITAHVRLVVDGVTHDLTGSLPTGDPMAPASAGTAAAFEAFWSRLSVLDGWLAADLGQSRSYSPTSVAFMLMPPETAPTDMTPQLKTWPLAGTFATFGKPMGVDGYRCATLGGADLGKLLPVVQESNQLTRFIDSTGAKASLQVRAVMPGEPDPCG